MQHFLEGISLSIRLWLEGLEHGFGDFSRGYVQRLSPLAVFCPAYVPWLCKGHVPVNTPLCDFPYILMNVPWLGLSAQTLGAKWCKYCYLQTPLIARNVSIGVTLSSSSRV
ncbi:hypothetical protein VNO77_30897 [Canavalia gladiata]|uniref:Uncharacterized protein n=1 Tax=Canavalia gladiata TaxID=3824 RepID=A0AAN9KS07_CANGL